MTETEFQEKKLYHIKFEKPWVTENTKRSNDFVGKACSIMNYLGAL